MPYLGKYCEAYESDYQNNVLRHICTNSQINNAQLVYLAADFNP